MANLTGKTALVTGASRGIGRAIARRLAADGALVAVHYGNSQAAATETVAAIQADGGMAFPVRAELGVDGDVDTLFAGLEAGLSGQRLDILVNNAATRAAAFIEQATPKEFDRMFAVNVRAPLFIIQRALPLLRDGARIINLSSSDTRVALPLELAYAMTKGAVNVMTQTLANALGARGITVNAVAPGPTDTDMTAFMGDPEVQAATASATALGRVGQPADIADAVAFLASDDALDHRATPGRHRRHVAWAPHVSAASPAPYQGEDSQHRTALPADMEARDAAPTDSTARGCNAAALSPNAAEPCGQQPARSLSRGPSCVGPRPTPEAPPWSVAYRYPKALAPPWRRLWKVALADRVDAWHQRPLVVLATSQGNRSGEQMHQAQGLPSGGAVDYQESWVQRGQHRIYVRDYPGEAHRWSCCTASPTTSTSTTGSCPSSPVAGW